jgi:hypothetical protein
MVKLSSLSPSNAVKPHLKIKDLASQHYALVYLKFNELLFQ